LPSPLRLSGSPAPAEIPQDKMQIEVLLFVVVGELPVRSIIFFH
jgi:hypothetical protein